jgi:NAD+ synthase
VIKLNFSKDILQIKDIQNLAKSLQDFIHEQTFEKYRKRGIIIGISGGIDSAVAATLACNAVGKENVLGLILPEKESNPESQELAKKLCKKLEIESIIDDITPILTSSLVYKIKEEIVQKYFPDFNKSCNYRLIFSENFDNDGLSIPYLEIQDSENQIHKTKISPNDYLTITAATNIKHRIRMSRLYFHGEKNNFLVCGTTNKAEFQQGYFVKYGDGGVDIEPLANLFKTQVYQLAKSLNITHEIIQRKASPDTWSFDVSDEEFFYSLPYEIIDLMLYAKEKSISVDKICSVLNLNENQIKRILKSQERKRNSSETLRIFPPSFDMKDFYRKF